MKELSIEEKAKAYDEAKEKAKVLKECSTNMEVVRYMDELFSELAESDDERIRKALINGFKDYKGWDEEWFDGITVREAIAWLESKDYQKPTKEHDVCDFCDERYGCVNPCSVKLIEQNPAWSEEDEINLDWLITVCERIHYKSDQQVSLDSALGLKNWLKGIKDRIQLHNTWKPSDEQMLAVDTSINVIGKGTLNGKCLIELYEQLKKLRRE
jgi:hypothetical protein